MDEKRHHQRIDCESKCLLYYAKSKYYGVIKNISLSGASIKLESRHPVSIQSGESCSLILCADPETCFCNYSGRITRVTPSGGGLEFIENLL